jgi:Spy/CpxP family protein refolding chaperone
MKSLENLMAFKSQTAKKCMAVIAAASLASFASVAVFAEAIYAEKKTSEQVQHHKHHNHHGDMDGQRGAHKYHGKDHMGAKLDLTDAQKEAMNASRTAKQASMKDLHEKLRSAHDALDKAAATNTDDAMLNKLSTDLANVIAQKEFAQAKARRDFINLLTPEQKQKLAAFEAEHKNAPSKIQ